MTSKQVIPLAALIGIAACAPKRAADPYVPVISELSPGIFEVSARLVGEHEDGPIHCAAAREASANGMLEMNWIEGVVSLADGPAGTASYRYFASRTEGAALPEAVFDKVFGGSLPVSTWLGHCNGVRA